VHRLSPQTFGCDELDPAGLAGGNAEHNASVLRKVLAGLHIGHGERYEAVLRAAAMTAALGLELIQPGEFEPGRLPEQFRRAVNAARDGSGALTLHRWREVSHATVDADLSELASKSPAEFVGVE
jgi:anthranilate phosphoribosyltransferase